MFNVADIVVIVIVLIAIFRGYKKGFIKTGFGILSFFIAIAITFMFYKPVMQLIKEKTGFEDWITEYLYSIDLTNETKELSSGETEVVLSTSGESYIDNLPQTLIDLIGIEEAKASAKATVIEKIVEFVLKLLSIIIVYIVAKIILAIVVLILDSIASLPILKQFNELLGLLLGGIVGLLQVYLLCAIIALIASLPVASGIINVVNNSMFTHIFYNNNLILEILF